MASFLWVLYTLPPQDTDSIFKAVEISLFGSVLHSYALCNTLVQYQRWFRQ